MSAALDIVPDVGTVLGAGAVVCARPPRETYGVLPGDRHAQDALSAPPIAIAGAAPVICSAGAATAMGLELVRAAGLPVSPDIRTYRSPDEYRAHLQSAARAGSRLALQHVHPEDEVPGSACLVRPATMRFLNNKGNLAALVDRGYLPRRRLIDASRAAAAIAGCGDRWVLKAAIDVSNGGGYDVLLHRGGPDPGPDLPEFGRRCARLILEEYLDAAVNWCLHFCVDVRGRVRWLGSTEQVVAEDGHFLGGWVGEMVQPHPEVVEACRAVVERAAELGYRGFCGIDAMRTVEGRTRIYDLNFRLNGSTPGLLLFNALGRDATERRCGLWRSWSRPGPLRELCQQLIRPIEDGILVPAAMYDPSETDDPNGTAMLYGLMLAGGREELRAMAAELETSSLMRSPAA